ncbi:hypothetical protein [Streptomyces sp. NPDC002205]|uniref:hypothetical protein n=1 Tax=Streptomyces sp. NPDC002205 TaxID=3154411 RepID=UPI00332AFCCC
MRTPVTADPHRLRVLVVEDDHTIGHHLATGLRGNDYVPTWSRTGSAALVEAARTPYDVLPRLPRITTLRGHGYRLEP